MKNKQEIIIENKKTKQLEEENKGVEDKVRDTKVVINQAIKNMSGNQKEKHKE